MASEREAGAGAQPRLMARIVQRIRAEYEEMPEMCLTLAQAARFWNLDLEVCERALGQLVREGFLIDGQSGYGRAHRAH